MFFYLLRHYSTVFLLCAHSSSLALFPNSRVTGRCRQQNKESPTWTQAGCVAKGLGSGSGVAIDCAPIREAGGLGLGRSRGPEKPEEILGLLQGGHSFPAPTPHSPGEGI